MLTKRDKYVRQLYICRAHAASAAVSEISALWETIEASYRFLVEREDRLAREFKEDGIGFYDPPP